MKLHKPHVSHKTIVTTAWSIIALILLSEGFCALHCWTQHDVVTAWLVVAAWGREGFAILLERIGEAALS